MPVFIVQIVEIILPYACQFIINRYSKREQTPEVQAKIQAHQTALDAIKGSK